MGGNTHMSITCSHILTMPEIKNNIKLLAGEKGLKNTVRWTHVLESLEAIQFLQGNELTFLTGIYVGNNEELLISVIEQLAAQHVAGLVVNTGKFITSISERAIKKADELMLPLFEIPWAVHLVEVTRLIGAAIIESDMEERSVAYLLEKILLTDQKDYDDYIQTAGLYGYSLKGPLRIADIEIPNIQQYAENSKNCLSLLNCQNQIELIISNVLESNAKRCLSMWKGSSLFFIVPVEPLHETDQVESIAKKISADIEAQMSGLVIYMGLGGYYDGIGMLKKSFSEAQLAVKLARDSGARGYVLYRNAGIYKFLNKLGDKKVMIDFYKETLGPLLKYDAENNTEFTDTLRVYLEEGENTASSIQRLYIHRNTLQYRLHRVEEIMCQSLKNSEEKINIQIAFKIQKFLSYKGMSVKKQSTD